jgi:hypothetical protein
MTLACVEQRPVRSGDLRLGQRRGKLGASGDPSSFVMSTGRLSRCSEIYYWLGMAIPVGQYQQRRFYSLRERDTQVCSLVLELRVDSSPGSRVAVEQGGIRMRDRVVGTRCSKAPLLLDGRDGLSGVRWRATADGLGRPVVGSQPPRNTTINLHTPPLRSTCSYSRTSLYMVY